MRPLTASSGIACRIAVAVSLLAGTCAAQNQMQANPADSTPEGTPIGGVYVHDSAVAMDKMALARRLEDQKDWIKSAEVYQEITDKYRDRVVPSPVQDDPDVLSQYVSVLSRVTEHLSAWPDEGLAVYRARYELTAQKLLQSAIAGDLGPLHEAFTRYFVTDTGKQAGLKLIDDYFELGEFSAAEWIGRQLLLHPSLQDQRARVLFQIGLAAHLSGDDGAASESLQELKDKFPQAIATIGGRDVNLADELNGLLIRPVHATVAAADGDSWPMPGGDESRGKISRSTVRPGARLYSVNLAQRSWKFIPDPNQRKMMEDRDKEIRAQGAMLGVTPVADHGELFFQTNNRVYAIQMDSGAPLAGWLATYPSHNGQYTLPVNPAAVSLPAWHQLSLTLTDSVVLAVMNLADPMTSGDGKQARLVCLDRHSGRELWVRSTQDLPDDSLKQLSLGGSPLVVGNNVYLAARGGKGNGYEDCYVLCLDVSTGDYRWSCYLASAPASDPQMFNPNTSFLSSMSDVSTHLSYASGRVFACTNLGAVASLDAYNGNVAWLDIYRDADDAVGQGYMPMGVRGFVTNNGPQEPIGPPPWTPNAPIVRDGNVFVLPSDGKYLLVYDAGTGRVVKKLAKDQCCQTVSDDTPEKPDTLLGIVRNKQGEELILVATSSRIFAINWRKYNPDHPDAAVAWASMPEPKDTIRGRPFVTADSVYVPEVLTLYRLQLRNGLTIDTYPADSSWPDDEGPGNVLVCGDKIIIAGDSRVSVYTDLTLARAKLDEQVTAAPTDPDVRLRYAEVMFLANQPDLALARLDEATELLRKGDHADNRAARTRAFNDAMTFAIKRPPELAGALFDRAAALAGSPAEKAGLLMARAGLARFGPQPDYGQAIQIYQQILADSALRSAPVPDVKVSHQPIGEADDETNLAGPAAAAAIAAVIRDHGTAVYQAIEQAAKTEAAAAAHDPVQLAEVAERYPNSSVAASAAMAAADQFEAKGMHRDAIGVLREIYFQGNSQNGDVLQALARNYLRVPGRIDAARASLIAASPTGQDAKLIKPLVLPNRTALAATTLHSAINEIESAIGKSAELPSDDLPDFGLPSHAAVKGYEADHHGAPAALLDSGPDIENVDKLLVPEPELARYDRIVTWTAGSGLAIRLPGQAAPLGIDPDISREPLGIAWVNRGADLLVWTGTEIAIIDGSQFNTRWKQDVGSLPELTVVASAAPEQNAYNNMAIQQLDPQLRRRLLRNRLMPLPRNGRIFMPGFSPRLGFVVPPDPGGDGSENKPIAMVEETISSVIPLGGRAILATSTGRVLAVDLTDGSIRWQTRAVGHGVDRLCATDDFTVFKSTDDNLVQIVLFDTGSGKMLARRVFGQDPSALPINLALGEDGTLAYSQSDRVMMFNLYESAGDRRLIRPQSSSPLAGDEPQLFAGMVRPDQLLIHGGQILALCDGGQSLRGYDAQTGQLRDGPMRLSTGDRNDLMGLRLSDGYVYACGPRSAAAYDVETPDAHWGPEPVRSAGAAPLTLMGKDYLLLLQAPPAVDSPAQSWLLSAFSRARSAGKESGAKVFDTAISNPHGILACQPLSGGICYLSGDRSLHLLLGNRNLAAR